MKSYKPRLPKLFAVINTIALGASIALNANAWTILSTDLEDSVGRRAIQSMLVDSRGRTWIGTQSGLVEFSEDSTRSAVSQDGAPWNSDVVGVVETANGSIIALTHSQGLYSRTPDSESFRPIGLRGNENLSNARSLWIDEQDNTWAITEDAVLVFYGATQPSEDLASYISIDIQTLARDAAELGNGATCFGTDLGVQCGKIGKDANFSSISLFGAHNAGDCDPAVTAISHSKESHIVIAGTRSGQIVAIDERGLLPPKCHFLPKLEGVAIHAVVLTEAGFLLGTSEGLFSSPDSFDEIARVSPDGRYVSGLTRHQELVWASTEVGLFAVSNTKFSYWPEYVDKETLDVTAISEGPNDSILVAEHGSIFLWRTGDPTGHQVPMLDKSGSRLSLQVTAIAKNEDHYAIGTRNDGLYLFDYRGGVLRETDTLLHGMGITAITAARDVFAVGTYKSGLFAVQNGKAASIPGSVWSSGPKSPVTSITSTRDGSSQLIVTYEDSVVRVCVTPSPRTCAEYANPVGRDNPRFLSSAIGNDSSVWIGSLNSGLYKIDHPSGAQRQSVTKVHAGGVSKLSVYGISATRSGDLWLATNYGVWRVNQESLHSSRFDEPQGQVIDDFNHGASMTNGRRILFGSPFGVLSFFPEEIVSLQSYAHIAAIAVSSGGSPYHPTTGRTHQTVIEVTAPQADIGVLLSIGELVRLSEVRYSYMLEGHHTTWQDNGSNPEIKLSNLPPGNYVLRARGSNSAGVWSENEIELPIVVLPPWWLTWPAYVLYLFIAAGFLLLVKRASEVGALRANRDALELEVSLSQEREIDELQAHIETTARIAERSEARLLDVLSCIDAFVETELEQGTGDIPVDRARKTAHRVRGLRLLQQFVEVRFEEATCDLNSYTNALFDEFLFLDRERSQRVITVNNADLDAVPTEHAIYIAAVMYEFIANAFENAFPFDKDGAVIAARVDRLPSVGEGSVRYEVCVEDNGVGPKDFEVQEVFERGGLGLVYRLCLRLDGAVEVADTGGTRAAAIMNFPTEQD